ncbi:hypothetical protein BC939DRAFT_492869 [Gamsiella multidivaricata]|uniref:uncharacterized protein n=1 Tax=Gamsiella multidivaricata TaxID=101098 RepID=UPI00221E6B28|nr:uncharacterized protein BC939DRAFT_492869 [Gamsiella multidivaricata]KAI7823834.1 hypothetical protein BC939DRAFT_492869 [Gamsiella multidivaricata]
MSTPKPKPKLSYKAQSFPSNDKPFECSACRLYFRRLHDLKRHERLHTGERPYCCNNCRRTFARLDALKRHLSAESNIHCSEWTYQPGLVTGPGRSGVRHHRSISLPHVHGSDVQANPPDTEDSTGRTPTTPNPMDHPSFHYHYYHRQSRSSPDSRTSTGNLQDAILEENGNSYPPRYSPAAATPEHKCWQERLQYGAMQSKRSMPQLNSDRPMQLDMIASEDASVDRVRPQTSALFEALPPVLPYPQSSSHPHPSPPTQSYALPHPDPHPHSQQPFPSSFRKTHPQQRRDSYLSSPSQSTLSPSSSPGLSPTSSSMSTFSMSSPTNIWSYSKGPETLDTTAPRAGPHHEDWHQSRSECFSQRFSQQDPSPFQEGNGPIHDHRHWEYDRRPGPSLGSTLNSSTGNSYPPAVQTPSSAPSKMRHSRHSHSFSHPLTAAAAQTQHHYHRRTQQHPPSQDPEHCCDAMVEIQKLRQQLQWVTMQYHTLAERGYSNSNSNSGNSNHSDDGVHSNGDRPSMPA